MHVCKQHESPRIELRADDGRYIVLGAEQLRHMQMLTNTFSKQLATRNTGMVRMG